MGAWGDEQSEETEGHDGFGMMNKRDEFGNRAKKHLRDQGDKLRTKKIVFGRLKGERQNLGGYN